MEDKNFKELKNRIEDFKKALISHRAYSPKDPVDVSVIPRIIKSQEAQKIEKSCLPILEASLSKLSYYISNPKEIPTTPINNELKKLLPIKQKFLSGNARFDFLYKNDELKLIELNFLNVGSSGYSTKTCISFLETFPEFSKKISYKNPVSSIKKRLMEREIKYALLLTKNDDTEMSYIDRKIIKEEVKPIEMFIVPEKQYNLIKFNSGNLFYEETKIDAVYPRYFDSRESISKNEEFCKKICDSNVFIFDHFATQILEDKDLRLISTQNKNIEHLLAKTIDVNPTPKNLEEYVLKFRDLHSGEGVILSPKKVELENTILQERIPPKKTFVYTIEGKEGYATYDTSAYVSYCYDLKNKKLDKFEVSGYLTRFSLLSDIVNMCKGGGIIPTFIEK